MPPLYDFKRNPWIVCLNLKMITFAPDQYHTTVKRLIIFDLDGTLLDTIEDLAASTNHALQANGFPTHDTDAYKRFVGNGIMKLFERALPADAVNEDNINRIKTDFLAYYDIHNCDFTHPYEGICEMLEQLGRLGIGLAVASNKYDSAVQKLIPHYFGKIAFTAIAGNKAGINPKPSPAIINSIMATGGYDKTDVLYVGDSDVDMQTAINAGVEACGVTWGFRPVEELIKYNPAHIAKSPSDIINIARL